MAPEEPPPFTPPHPRSDFASACRADDEVVAALSPRAGRGVGGSTRWRTALAVLLVLSGLALVAQGAWIPAKAALAQVLLARAFDAALRDGGTVRPWPWADTYPVARIGFPALRKTFVALAGSSGQALAFGPGHVEGTPEAGEPGTAVYAAHRDTQFGLLGQLKPGDPVAVTRRDGRTATFRVTGSRIARWDGAGIDPAAPGRRLALVTCWPLDAITHGPERLIVEADALP